MWILVVASDRGLLERARRMLVALGHHVVGARGPGDAMVHLHLHPFDLVASDPDCAGHPWAASLRDRWDTFDVPLAVFRDPAELAAPLRRVAEKESPRPLENSTRGWPGGRDVRMASRLLSVYRATRR
ncbi:MAG TPA: hypothetical protein VF950_29065 [Planctomycetota bacterium]